MRVLRDLVDLLRAQPRLDDPSLEIATWAHRFSRRTRRVLDDKLTFSATLMRAGEVEAANRLLAEVEDEVRNEEVALMERVAEVKVARVITRARMTRLRLARTLAVAVVGAAMTGASAAGVALVGALGGDPGSEGHSTTVTRDENDARVPERARGTGRDGRVRRVRIAGREVVLTKGDLKLVQQLASGTATPVAVQHILDLLPPAVRNVIEKSAVVRAPEEVADMLLRAVKNKKKKDRAEDQQPQPEPSESSEPAPSPEPSPSPSPSPSETGGNGNGGGNGGPGNEGDDDDQDGGPDDGGARDDSGGELGPIG